MSHMEKQKVSQFKLTLLLIVIIGFFLGAVVYIFKQLSVNEPNKQTVPNVMDSETLEEEDEQQEGTSICVLEEVDTDAKTVLLYDIKRDCMVKLSYTGTTDIRDQYSQVIAAAQLEISSIVEAIYEESNQTLSYLVVSKDAWEYQNVTAISPDISNKVLQLYGQKYRYTSKLFVMDADGECSLLSIHPEDVLTIRGYDKTIYSIAVTKGHGTLMVTNVGYFEGGNITINGTEYEGLTTNMVVTLREGVAEVEIQKEEEYDNLQVTILRNEETQLDLSKYQPEPEKKGEVTFDILPFGAELYIDGELTSYANPVEMTYGDHILQVMLTGYESYEGSYTLLASSDVVQIELAATIETVEDEGEETDSGTNTDNASDTTENSNSDTTDKQESDSDSSNSEDSSANSTDQEDANLDSSFHEVDEEHTITINSPSGVSVYINGVYKGITPLTITKPVGRTYITLLREGCEQITHTMNIKDDGEDKLYTFPNLVVVEDEQE